MIDGRSPQGMGEGYVGDSALGRYVHPDKLTARCSRSKYGCRRGWLEPVGREV
jgi:hypothetical protein